MKLKNEPNFNTKAARSRHSDIGERLPQLRVRVVHDDNPPHEAGLRALLQRLPRPKNRAGGLTEAVFVRLTEFLRVKDVFRLRIAVLLHEEVVRRADSDLSPGVEICGDFLRNEGLPGARKSAHHDENVVVFSLVFIMVFPPLFPVLLGALLGPPLCVCHVCFWVLRRPLLFQEMGTARGLVEQKRRKKERERRPPAALLPPALEQVFSKTLTKTMPRGGQRGGPRFQKASRQQTQAKKKATQANQQQKNKQTRAQIDHTERARLRRERQEKAADGLLAKLDPPRVRVPVPRDGSCLFRAVASHQNAFSSPLYGQRAREACVREMAARPDDFSPFCVSNAPFDHYIAEMARPKTWGGNLEIQAMSVVFKLNFRIFSHTGLPEVEAPAKTTTAWAVPPAAANPQDENQGTLVETLVDNGFEDCIDLILFGNHYDILYPEREFEVMRVMQSAVYDLIDAAVEAAAGPRPSEGDQGDKIPVFWSDDAQHVFRPLSWERWTSKQSMQMDNDAAVAHGVSESLADEFEELTGFYRKTGPDAAAGAHSNNTRQRPRKGRGDVIVLTGNKSEGGFGSTEPTPASSAPAVLDATDGFDFPSLPPQAAARARAEAIAAAAAPVSSEEETTDVSNTQLGSIFRAVRGEGASTDAAKVVAADESTPGESAAETAAPVEGAEGTDEVEQSAADDEQPKPVQSAAPSKPVNAWGRKLMLNQAAQPKQHAKPSSKRSAKPSAKTPAKASTKTSAKPPVKGSAKRSGSAKTATAKGSQSAKPASSMPRSAEKPQTTNSQPTESAKHVAGVKGAVGEERKPEPIVENVSTAPVVRAAARGAWAKPLGAETTSQAKQPGAQKPEASDTPIASPGGSQNAAEDIQLAGADASRDPGSTTLNRDVPSSQGVTPTSAVEAPASKLDAAHQGTPMVSAPVFVPGGGPFPTPVDWQQHMYYQQMAQVQHMQAMAAMYGQPYPQWPGNPQMFSGPPAHAQPEPRPEHGQTP
jgi:OTU-like cysteine protease